MVPEINSSSVRQLVMRPRDQETNFASKSIIFKREQY
jgi:hypothetical protein